MSKKMTNFRFPNHITELLEKTAKATGKSKVSIVSDATIKECKKLLKEIETIKDIG